MARARIDSCPLGMKEAKILLVALLGIALSGTPSVSNGGARVMKHDVERLVPEDGSVRVSAFTLPPSEFLSDRTRAVLAREAKETAAFAKTCAVKFADIATEEDVLAYRECLDKFFYPSVIRRVRARYHVVIRSRTIGGVPTEVVTPADGIVSANRERVLINVHGGNFMFGARWGGEVESIPIAALGKFKVVTVNYRMAPEYRFPAGSDDVTKVYAGLLTQYKAEDIGIYGCSAGAFIVAEAVAAILKKGMPVPGAVGLLCGGALPGEGDSAYWGAALSGAISSTSARRAQKELSYFTDLDLKNPLAFPGISPALLARFPDTVLITSTRDLLLSAVVTTHARLISAGASSDLYVWEGLGHAFFLDERLPESGEAYEVIVRFFSRHLGRQWENFACGESARR